MIISSFLIIFIVLLLLPFLPGMREYFIEEDGRPLHINMDYTRNPRYFGHSFRKVFLQVMQNHNRTSSGLHLIELSKQELVKVVDNAAVGEGSIIETLYYARQSFQSGPKVLFKKEIYSLGTAHIGDYNQLRALSCDGDIKLGKGTKVSRWVDAEGNVTAEEQCNLGISTTCTKSLVMEKGCEFKRLYGFPITTDKAHTNDLPINNEAFFQAEATITPHYQRNSIRTASPVDILERNLSSISPHSVIYNSVITMKCLTIGANSFILGDIKTHSDLIIRQEVIIKGNIFAEGDIFIGPNCRIDGTVFTQGRIVLCEGVIIGSPNHVKSVVSKHNIVLHRGVRVYGYISTEGEGKVV